ncbi:hypothetical protein ACS0TY_014756 [Phlomoides rotata]
MEKEEARKGPWTEEEDGQLVFYVKLLGDRRWDFIAQVSGLKVGGRHNIYRLRWVNYLHPDLKRGKITPHEERLILEFQSKWGNRWSRIAQKLPGRTDNEIKNYWRTLMRKKAQEWKKKKGTSPSSSSSLSSSSISYHSSSDSPRPEFARAKEAEERGFYDTGGAGVVSGTPGEKKSGLEVEESNKMYTIDDIWKEFEFSEENCSRTTYEAVASPIWDYYPNDSLWCMDEQPMGDHFQSFPFYNYMIG